MYEGQKQKKEKLVRDNIISIAKSGGHNMPYRIVKGDEYRGFLAEKLQEEALEFTEDRNEEELADVLEVIDAISAEFKLNHRKFDIPKVAAGVKELTVGDEGKTSENLITACDRFNESKSLRNLNAVMSAINNAAGAFGFLHGDIAGIAKIKASKRNAKGGFSDGIVVNLSDCKNGR